jgi:hypothetical protein
MFDTQMIPVEEEVVLGKRTLICKQCKKEFTVDKTRFNGRRVYCSKECQQLYYRVTPVTFADGIDPDEEIDEKKLDKDVTFIKKAPVEVRTEHVLKGVGKLLLNERALHILKFISESDGGVTYSSIDRHLCDINTKYINKSNAYPLKLLKKALMIERKIIEVNQYAGIPIWRVTPIGWKVIGLVKELENNG